MLQDRLKLTPVFVAASCLGGILLLSSHWASAQEPDKGQNKAPAPAAATSPLPKVVAAVLSGDEIDQDPSEAPNNQAGTDPGQVATLNSDHMISLKDIVRNHLLYGVSFTERIAGTSNISRGSLHLWNPYLGFLGRLGRTTFVLQYAPSISERWLVNGGPKAYHSTSLFVTRELSQKWGMGFGLNSGFGEYGLSLTASSFRPAPVPIINPPLIQPGLTNIYVNDAELNVHWRPTLRQSLSFSTSEVYRNAVHVGHNNLAAQRAHYDQMLSRRTSFLAYGEYGESFQLVPCKTYGGGAGLLFKTGQNISLRLTAGPEFASGGCATRKDIKTNSSLVVPYGKRSSFYIAYDRDFNDLFVSPLVQSRNSIVGGYHWSMVRGISLRLDGGYYKVQQCCGQPAFHSGFVSPLFTWPVVRTLTFLANYRYFSDKQIDLLGYGQNQFMLTLQWKPRSRESSR